MPEQERIRDCMVLTKSTLWPVRISPAMRNAGWKGGQGVHVVDDGAGYMSVGISDGLAVGFMLIGSDEPGDRFLSYAKTQTTYHMGPMGAGGWVISTTSFERYTYASRQVPPLVPLVYGEGDPLVFSLRGYWTKEDEWTLSGDPRGTNDNYVGSVAKVLANGYLDIQVRL